MVQVFSAASVLIGLAAVGQLKRGTTIAVLVAIAVSAFLVVAGQAIRALWTRRFRVSISPDQLWYRYWSEETADIKHAFVADAASGYVENDEFLKKKRRALGAALLALGVEAIAVGVALTVSAI